MNDRERKRIPGRRRHVCVTVSLGPPFATMAGNTFWKRNDTSCANHLSGSPGKLFRPPGTDHDKKPRAQPSKLHALNKSDCATWPPHFDSRPPVSDGNSRSKRDRREGERPECQRGPGRENEREKKLHLKAKEFLYLTIFTTFYYFYILLVFTSFICLKEFLLFLAFIIFRRKKTPLLFLF